MKLPYTIFLIFILTFQCAIGQVMDTSISTTPQENFDFYNLKQKRQKTAAWICLGGGVAMTLTGLVIKGGHKTGEAFGEMFGEILTLGLADFEETEPPPIANFLIYLGGASTAASIPLFVSAGNNKRKASLSIKGEPLTFGKLNTRKSQLVSVLVTIDL